MNSQSVNIKFVLRCLQLLILTFYLVWCPYTKVEESFNIQAVHDVLLHGRNLSLYDHNEFPGVVPRTFIGPLIIATLSYPFKAVIYHSGLEIIYLQYISRFVLGLLVLHSLWRFNNAVEKFAGIQTANYAALISLTQFHFLFYATRPLPNIFALSLSTHALSFYLSDRPKAFIWVSAFVIIVFRTELSILLGFCLLVSFVNGTVSFRSIVSTSVPAGIISLFSTVAVDSWFWNRWLWPEGEVLYFNTVLNKSSQWGTLPFLWYFYSALPRMLLGALLFLPWGVRCYPRKSLFVLCPAIGFVFLYSFLPHKELRFIIYTIPLFNVVAANAIFNMHNRYSKYFFGKLGYIVMASLLLISCLCCIFFLIPSYYNYPGGFALAKLHKLVPCHKGDMHVYIDNFVAQTGASLFGQLCSNWTYNKTEHVNLNLRDMKGFSHILLESDASYGNLNHQFEAIYEVTGIKMQLSQFPPKLVKVVRAVILQRSDIKL